MSLIFPLGTERMLQSHNPMMRKIELFMYETCLETKIPREGSGKQLQYYHYFTY